MVTLKIIGVATNKPKAQPVERLNEFRFRSLISPLDDLQKE